MPEKYYRKGELTMYKTPEISAIMSVYNGEAYLAEAIESVRNQTFENWELIVINDCSTDSTGEILRAWCAEGARSRVQRKPAASGILKQSFGFRCGEICRKNRFG